MPTQQLASDFPLMLALFLCGALGYVTARWFKTRMRSSILHVQKLAEDIEEDNQGDLVQTTPADQVFGMKLSTTLEAKPETRRRSRRQAKPKNQRSMPLVFDAEQLTNGADINCEIEEVPTPSGTTEGWDSTATSQVSTSAGTTSASSDTDKDVPTKSVNSRVEKIMAKKVMRKARKLQVLECGPSSDPTREQSLPQVGTEVEGEVTVELPSLPEPVPDSNPIGQHSRMVGETSPALATYGNDAELSAESVPTDQLAEVLAHLLSEGRDVFPEGKLRVQMPNDCADEFPADDCTSDWKNVHENMNRLMLSIDDAEACEGEEAEELRELAKFLDDLPSDDESDYYDEDAKDKQYTSELPETEEPGSSESASYPGKLASDVGNSTACWDTRCSSLWKVGPKHYPDDWMTPFAEISDVGLQLPPQRGSDLTPCAFEQATYDDWGMEFDSVGVVDRQEPMLALGPPFQPLALEEGQEQLYTDGRLVYKMMCVDVNGIRMNTAEAVVQSPVAHSQPSL